MTPYYYLTTTLRDWFEANQLINTVTHGDMYRIDLSKQSIYAIAHIIIGEARPTSNAIQFTCSVVLADLVDISKNANTNNFIGNDNEIDVLNSMLVVGTEFVQHLLRGDLWSDNLELIGSPFLEPFIERFENNLAGWTVNFDVLIPNEISVC